jgi:hypothetical protein
MPEQLLTILMIVAKSAYFYLPAVAANMAPVVVAKIVPGNWPIWETRLGRNKTWRGLIAGIIAAGIVFAIQKDLMFTRGGSYVSLFDYREESTIVWALLFGGGALVGDALKSFFKRRIWKGEIWPSWHPVPVMQRKYPDGAKWYPMDQVDFIIGSTIFVSFIHFPGWEFFGTVLFLTLFLHPAVNYVAFKIGLKKVPH